MLLLWINSVDRYCCYLYPVHTCTLGTILADIFPDARRWTSSCLRWFVLNLHVFDQVYRVSLITAHNWRMMQLFESPKFSWRFLTWATDPVVNVHCESKSGPSSFCRGFTESDFQKFSLRWKISSYWWLFRWLALVDSSVYPSASSAIFLNTSSEWIMLAKTVSCTLLLVRNVRTIWSISVVGRSIRSLIVVSVILSCLPRSIVSVHVYRGPLFLVFISRSELAILRM